MTDTALAKPVETPVAASGDAMISLIERAARDPNVDIEKFERLMLMKERVDRQQALMAFNDAVAAAKGEFGPIAKNRTVDFTTQKGRTTYKHEDFARIASVVDPVLKKHGLAYRFRSAQNGTKLSVTCILSHTMGHAEETSLETGEDHSGNKNATQAVGSAATYLQRYTLKLALGLASAHDDDARGSTETGAITADQSEELARLITETGTDIQAVLDFHKVESLSDMTAQDYRTAKAKLIARNQHLAKEKTHARR